MRDKRSQSQSWMFLCIDKVRVMEGSLGKSLNNKCLYFPELLCQHWILGWLVRGYLHRLRVRVIGHGNGSQGWFVTPTTTNDSEPP